MKVAVSIPDAVFEAAERAAKRMSMPRSQFYARALATYVKRQARADVTARLNDVQAKAGAGTDMTWPESSLDVLRRSEW